MDALGAVLPGAIQYGAIRIVPTLWLLIVLELVASVQRMTTCFHGWEHFWFVPLAVLTAVGAIWEEIQE